MEQSASKSSMQVLFGAFVGKIINYLSLLLVTPVLGPEGFGQLLVVGIILAIFTVVIDVGFENYYIVRVKLNGPDQSSPEEIALIENIVFKIRLYSNLVLFTLQVGISYLGKGHLFDAPIDIYLRILSLNYLIAIFGKINEVRLKKRLMFGVITNAKVSGDIVGAIAKVGLVYAGMGLVGWATGLIVANFISTIFLTLSGHYKPKLVAIPDKWKKEVFWFAKHSWFNGLGGYLYNQVSSIIIKSFFPLHQVGLVYFSYSNSIEIQSGILSSQMNVLLPYYANFQHDPKRVRAGINKYIEGALLVMGFPIIIGMVFSYEILTIAFGDQWIEAAPIFSLYCIYALVRIIFSPALSILTALRKMKESTIITYFSFAVVSLSLLAVSYFLNEIFWYAFVFVFASLLVEGLKALWGLSFLKIQLLEILQDCKKTLTILAIVLLSAVAIKFSGFVVSVVTLVAVVVVLGLLFLAATWKYNKVALTVITDKLPMLKQKFRIKR